MSVGRVTRLSLGTLMLGGAVAVLAPHATHFVSRSAVVNAPLVSLAAPFDGLFQSDPLAPADVVPPHTPVFELAPDPAERLERARIVSDISRLRGEIRALEREIEALESLDRALADRDAETRRLAHDVLALDLEAIETRINAAQVRYDRLSREASRQQRLVDAGSVPATVAEDAADLARVAQAERDRLRVEARRVMRERAAIDIGALPAFGTEDGAYARQRQDEIAIRHADLVSRRDRLAAALEAARSLLWGLSENETALQLFTPHLAQGMLAWTATPGQAAAVAAGQEVVQLLDCSRRFLEVPISETALRSVEIGDIAEVRLKGGGAPFPARVAAIRGAGSLVMGGSLAAAPVDLSPGRLTIIMHLPPANVQDAETAARFCDVGRTAQVRLSRDVPPFVADLGRDMRETLVRLGFHLRATGRYLAGLLGPDAG